MGLVGLFAAPEGVPGSVQVSRSKSLREQGRGVGRVILTGVSLGPWANFQGGLEFKAADVITVSRT